MPDFTQENRPLRVTIGDIDPKSILLSGFSGSESLSQLFSFTLQVVAPLDAPLKFEDVLGKPAVVEVDQGTLGSETRQFHGIINRMSQGTRDERFIYYQMELVPHFWLLTKTQRSRLFQQKTVKEILEEVLGPVYSPDFRLEATYHPRDLCVQYRESDFNFACRLMEEEGIYYYFTHANESGLVISDNPRGHDPIAEPVELIFQDDNNATPSEGRIISWEKAQELQTGNVDVTDYCFEMPTNDLRAAAVQVDKIKGGTVDHPLAVGGMDKAAIVEYPGGYAHWRDGIDPGGAERPADLDPLFEDNARIAGVRTEQEQVGTVRIDAVTSYCRLTAGLKFTLTEHYDADGDYVLTTVVHNASCGIADSGGPGDFTYDNEIACLPFDLPFRPKRETPRPVVKGSQTAAVVGPPDEEIFVDKYGRVKVQFHWDREGKRNPDSSCWIRVSQAVSGTQWGFQFWPRIGQEVIVDFLEGDPDQPIITGSVYNADHMPTYDVPKNKTQSGIKTRSSPGGSASNYNEIMFEDKKGQELVRIHAEKDMSITVEDNYTVGIGAYQKDPHKAGKSSTTIYGDTSTTVSKGDHKFTVATGKSDTTIKADTTVTIEEGNHTFTVLKGVVTEQFENRQTTEVKGNVDLKSREGDIKTEASKGVVFIQGEKEVKVTSVKNAVNIYAETEIKLVVGSSSLTMKKDGTIVLSGVKVTVHGSDKTSVTAPAVDLTGESKATVGVAAQALECTTSAVGISGAKITSSATGIHEITGAMVKIN